MRASGKERTALYGHVKRDSNLKWDFAESLASGVKEKRVREDSEL